MTPDATPVESPDDRRRTRRTYAGVLAVEAIVLAALWWLETTFGR